MRWLAPVGFAVLLAVSGAVEVWAHAGGGMGGITADDSCAREKGNRLIHFSAYQQRTEGVVAAKLAQLKDEELKRYLDATKEDYQSFCRDIPRTGKTTLTFDLISDVLRKIPVAVRVVEAAEGGESRMVLSIPQQIYPSGVIRAETDFAKAGKYTAIVEVEEHAGESHSGDIAQGAGRSAGIVEAVSEKHASSAEKDAYHAHDSTFSFPFRVGLKATGATAIVQKPVTVMMVIAGLAIGAMMYIRRKKKAASTTIQTH